MSASRPGSTTIEPPPRRVLRTPRPAPAAVLRMQAYDVLGAVRTWICAGSAVLVTAALAAMYVALAASTPEISVLDATAGSAPTVLEMGLSSVSCLVLAALLSGCLVAGPEWSCGQQTIVLSAVPARGRLLVARWSITGAFWSLVGLLSGLLVLALTAAIASTSPLPSTLEVVQLVGGTALASGLAACLGVSAATLFRSTLWSVVSVVVLTAVLPVFVSGIAAIRWVLPSSALVSLASLPSQVPGTSDPLLALLVALGWSIVVGAVAWWRLCRSDI